MAVSPNGKWVASGGYDNLLKIWALAAGAEEGPWVTNLQLGGGPVSSVAFSPDVRWLAARTWTNGFALLQAPGWQRAMTVTNMEKGPLGSLAFSADSRLLAVGGEVWNLDALPGESAKADPVPVERHGLLLGSTSCWRCVVHTGWRLG